MSIAKLQRLCYYCQAWSLVWNKTILFPEDFEAWETGPVCRDLLRNTQCKSSVSLDDYQTNDDNLTEDQKDTINHILDYYGIHDSQWLGQLSLMEEPWRIAHRRSKNGKYNNECNRVITKESIETYYNNL